MGRKTRWLSRLIFRCLGILEAQIFDIDNYTRQMLDVLGTSCLVEITCLAMEVSVRSGTYPVFDTRINAKRSPKAGMD